LPGSIFESLWLGSLFAKNAEAPRLSLITGVKGVWQIILTLKALDPFCWCFRGRSDLIARLRVHVSSKQGMLELQFGPEVHSRF
jgi:hypothetical protein